MPGKETGGEGREGECIVCTKGFFHGKDINNKYHCVCVVTAVVGVAIVWNASWPGLFFVPLLCCSKICGFVSLAVKAIGK